MIDSHPFTARILGMSSSLAGFGITLTALEQWIRISGAAVGLLIGIMTLIGMIRNWGKESK